MLSGRRVCARQGKMTHIRCDHEVKQSARCFSGYQLAQPCLNSVAALLVAPINCVSQMYLVKFINVYHSNWLAKTRLDRLLREIFSSPKATVAGSPSVIITALAPKTRR